MTAVCTQAHFSTVNTAVCAQAHISIVYDILQRLWWTHWATCFSHWGSKEKLEQKLVLASYPDYIQKIWKIPIPLPFCDWQWSAIGRSWFWWLVIGEKKMLIGASLVKIYLSCVVFNHNWNQIVCLFLPLPFHIDRWKTQNVYFFYVAYYDVVHKPP